MKWHAPIQKPEAGDLEIKTRFAWLPKQIGDKKVWLESYQELYEYVVRDRKQYLSALRFTMEGTWGEWELKDTKILSNV